ncbi:hypothetical protein QJS04_geneDACA007315 [Acorus gramineus]|uniref:glutathione transferase n=1 Tax=Acorus gramineus TaxID=55184 RepID=A0AAV9BNH1_ACOGR|nr:hypothetical protein QJS04_geneDACA007315 [Acorus gramineus]
MAGLKLYGVNQSTNVMRALVCLYEKGLDFEFVSVDMYSGEHKKDPFISFNPFGQVPVLEDGDIQIFESRAITEHLCRAYTEKGPTLLPSDKKALASVLTWKEVEAGQFNVPASKLAFELFYKSFLFGGTADEAVMAEHEERLAKVLDVYEVRLSKNNYLGGDEYSLADLNHLPCLHFLVGTPVKKIFDSRPHVSKWCTDALARPAWAKVVAMIVV